MVSYITFQLLEFLQKGPVQSNFARRAGARLKAATSRAICIGENGKLYKTTCVHLARKAADHRSDHLLDCSLPSRAKLVLKPCNDYHIEITNIYETSDESLHCG